MFDLAFFRTVYYVEFTLKELYENNYLAYLNARTSMNYRLVDELIANKLLTQRGDNYFTIKQYIIMKRIYFCN